MHPMACVLVRLALQYAAAGYTCADFNDVRTCEVSPTVCGHLACGKFGSGMYG